VQYVIDMVTSHLIITSVHYVTAWLCVTDRLPSQIPGFVVPCCIPGPLLDFQALTVCCRATVM